MITTQDQIDQNRTEYKAEFERDTEQEDAQASQDNMPEDEEAEPDAPAENAVMVADKVARQEQSRAFTEAFKAEAPMATEPKEKTFKEAFAAAAAAARKGGPKVFDWRGKKFTTEMAKPKAAPTVSVKLDGPVHETAAVRNAVKPEAKPAGSLAGASSLAEAMNGAKHTGMGSK